MLSREGIAQTSVSPSDDRIENNRRPRAAPMKNAARGITGDCGTAHGCVKQALPFKGRVGWGWGKPRQPIPLPTSPLKGEEKIACSSLRYLTAPEPSRRRREQAVFQFHALGVVVLQPQRPVEVDELRFARDFQRGRDAE